MSKDTQDPMTRILVAFASRENATVAEVLELAERLPGALGAQPSGTTAPTAPTAHQPKATPAVPISDSVSEERVTCLCCGKSFTMLKRHLKAEHGLTEDEYRERFGLSEDHPLTAPSYSIRKAEYAKSIGLGKYSREDGETPR
jgi:predicted transcriptional regulator